MVLLSLVVCGIEKCSKKRFRVLISAYACEPGKGSEAGVGWNLAREMAKHHEVWVLTRTRNYSNIEAEKASSTTPNPHFVYHDLPFASQWDAGHLEWQLYYYLWQIRTYFVARRLHREVGFDLTHHVTFGRHWGPSFLALLPMPFVWGPVGGGESAPKAFWRDFGPRSFAYEALRDAARWLGEHDPFVHLTARRSTLAIVSTPDTASRLRNLRARRVEYFPGQTGLNESEIEQLGNLPNPDHSPVRFISVGRLLHWKGFHLGLRAFARAHLPGAQYWIVGDGAERKRLEVLARNLGIEERVRFWGGLPRDETLRKLGESDALIHPALHDHSPTVCLEAMAAGRPVICLDLGGPAMQVTQETGVKVPAHTPNQSVTAMAEVMSSLANGRSLRRRLGEQGKERAKTTFAWNAKAEHLNRLYYEAVYSSRTS